jgi:hypothetical protein
LLLLDEGALIGGGFASLGTLGGGVGLAGIAEGFLMAASDGPVFLSLPSSESSKSLATLVRLFLIMAGFFKVSSVAEAWDSAKKEGGSFLDICLGGPAAIMLPNLFLKSSFFSSYFYGGLVTGKGFPILGGGANGFCGLGTGFLTKLISSSESSKGFFLPLLGGKLGNPPPPVLRGPFGAALGGGFMKDSLSSSLSWKAALEPLPILGKGYFGATP